MVKKSSVLKKQKINNNFFKKFKNNNNGTKSDFHTNHVPSTRHLTRIIMALKDIKEKVNQTEIARFSGIENSRLKGALNWLMNNKILCKTITVYGKDRGKYYLNPKWLALENEE